MAACRLRHGQVKEEKKDTESSAAGDTGTMSISLVVPWLKSVLRILKKRLTSSQYRLYYLPLLIVISVLLFIVYNVIVNDSTRSSNPSVHNQWCEIETDVPNYLTDSEPDEITLVTAYFNLGTIQHGNYWHYTTPYKYKEWMRPFGKIANRLVAFVEDDETADYLRKVRSCFSANHTKIIKVQRSELWSFYILDRVQKIYSNSTYPKYYPNTVNAEYTCATHAKYELLQSVLDVEYFESAAFAWVDAGYFQLLDNREFEPVKLLMPPKFDSSKIGFSQVYPRDPYFTPSQIMRNNLVWVSGGFVLGTSETLRTFVQQYKLHVEEFLEKGITNTDEQIIYAMYASTQELKREAKKLRTYICHEGQLGLRGINAKRFCLGFICKHVWDRIVPS